MTRRDLALAILQYKKFEEDQRFVLLRDIEGVVNGTFRDLDLFTQQFERSKFKDFLNENGFVIVKEITRYKFTQFCVLHKEEEVFLLIDIWTKLHYHGSAYFSHSDPTPVLQDKGFYHLDEHDSLAVSYIKCLTQSGVVKEKYKAQAKEANFEFESIRSTTLLGRRNAINVQDFSAKIKWAIHHIIYFLSKKQLVLYLIGPDGAGKTTISTVLGDNNIRAQSKYFHGRIPVLPRLQKLKGEIPKKVKFSDLNKRKFTTFHAMYYILDSLLARAYLNFCYNKDRIIICDRTHFDIVARESYRKIPKIIKHLLVKSLFRPDHCFLLTCDASEINFRKPELPVEEIEYQYKAYAESKTILGYKKIGTSLEDKSIAQIARAIDDDLYCN